MKDYLESSARAVVAEMGDELKAFSGRKVLITGAHGFLGSYFLALFEYINRELLSEPCEVLGMDNHITAGRVNDRSGEVVPHQKFIAHDVIRSVAISDPVDYIIHAAGIASPFYYRKYPLETLEVAVTGTRNLLELAVNKSAKGFLFFSSSEIYGNPDTNNVPTSESYKGSVSCTGPRACYDESKRLGETLCVIFQKMHGVPTKAVRPFNIYGCGMKETDYRVLPNFGNCIVGKRPLHLYGTGEQTRTFCHISDAIAGFTKVLLNGSPGEVYNIGNPEPEVTMLDLVNHLEKAHGAPLPKVLMEYPDSYPADEPMRRCPDIRKAALQLGYKPVVSLETGLKEFLDWAKVNYTGRTL